MEELGLIVAMFMASTDPPSAIIMSVAPSDTEVTYDVIGIGDDSVRGYRVRAFGEPVENGFALASVERTWLCVRGADEDGLCL